MSELPRVSIVVVSYRSRDFIDRCLAPFDDRPDIEIVLLENASGDGIAEHVRARFPRVKLIESEQNLGFARGNNRAFMHCTGRYVLLLNPDAFVDNCSVVDRMADHLDLNQDVGAVGPQLFNADGSHQTGDAGWRIGFGTVLAHAFMVQRLAAGVPSLYLTNEKLLERSEVDVDWVCGACMMLRADIIAKIGGMDEKVFMYGEDIEWGTRIRDAGWRIVFLPKLSVLHLQGATQKGEAQAFFSTKWLDDAAARYAQVGSATGYSALKVALAAGYGLRASLLIAGGAVRRRPQWRSKGRMMWRYARHAADLPSFADARRTYQDEKRDAAGQRRSL